MKKYRIDFSNCESFIVENSTENKARNEAVMFSRSHLMVWKNIILSAKEQKQNITKCTLIN